MPIYRSYIFSRNLKSKKCIITHDLEPRTCCVRIHYALRYPVAHRCFRDIIKSCVIRIWGKTGRFILISFEGKWASLCPFYPAFYPYYGVKWAISFKFLIRFKYRSITKQFEITISWLIRQTFLTIHNLVFAFLFMVACKRFSLGCPFYSATSLIRISL